MATSLPTLGPTGDHQRRRPLRQQLPNGAGAAAGQRGAEELAGGALAAAAVRVRALGGVAAAGAQAPEAGEGAGSWELGAGTRWGKGTSLKGKLRLKGSRGTWLRKNGREQQAILPSHFRVVTCLPLREQPWRDQSAYSGWGP